MSYLKISIRDEFSDAIMEKLKKASPRVMHNMAVQAASDTEPFVPARNMVLSESTRVVQSSIIYPGPYARMLYYGKVMVDPVTHAAGFLTDDGWKSRRDVRKIVSDRDLNISTAKHNQAQSHWFEASKIQNLDKWVKSAEADMKRELKK